MSATTVRAQDADDHGVPEVGPSGARAVELHGMGREVFATRPGVELAGP